MSRTLIYLKRNATYTERGDRSMPAMFTTSAFPCIYKRALKTNSCRKYQPSNSLTISFLALNSIPGPNF